MSKCITTSKATKKSDKKKSKKVKLTATPKYVPSYSVESFNKIKEFYDLCNLSQNELANILMYKLYDMGYEILREDGFIYAKGTEPVLLVAHMDTVHEQLPASLEIDTEDNVTVISAWEGIGGDDRCGIFMILKVLEELHCSVMFTEDEEIGCVGAGKACKNKELMEEIKNSNKFIIELDRKNSKDAVFYECDNEEFEKFICKDTGLTAAYGSFSDICYIAPAAELAAVNISSGYYDAHTNHEYVVWEDMMENIEIVKGLILAAKELEESFIYIQRKYSRYDYYDDWGDYDDYGSYGRYSAYGSYYGYYGRNRHSYATDYMETMTLYVEFEEDGKNKEVMYTDTDVDSAWGRFFIDHPSICYNDVLDWYCDYEKENNK